MGNRAIYQILVGVAKDDAWMHRFEDVIVTGGRDDGTLLTTAPIDQRTLHGILDAIHDFDVPLVAVVQVDHADQASSESTVDITSRPR
jgi:hypothetical protein